MNSRLIICLLALLVVVTSAAKSDNANHGPPQLDGRNFRITVLQEGSFLEVNDEPDGSLSFGGYLNDMLAALAQIDRANFTYDLFTPSGYGSACSPRLSLPIEGVDAQLTSYNATYRTQYRCGESDVNDLPLANHSTDMYLGLYYVTPNRQLANQFTIPYQPPAQGTLSMYGTATGVGSFDELVEQQRLGQQPPACGPGGTALVDFVRTSFPGIEIQDLFGGDAEIDAAFEDGTCQIYITDAPLVTQFVLRRSQEDRCIYHGKPVGMIGEPMGFGLSHYAIGVRQDIDPAVVHTLSYWMNMLMSCNSRDPDGSCPNGNLADFYAGRGGTGAECGYVANPPAPPEAILSPGSIAAVVFGSVVLAGFAIRYLYQIKLRTQAQRIFLLETYQKRLGLLDKVAEAQQQYLESSDTSVVYSCLLEGIVDLMDSAYGFIGEVKTDETTGMPYLHVHAKVDHGGTLRGGDVKYYNMDTLFGKVLTSKKAILSNDVVENQQLCSADMPIDDDDDTPLECFLGIPFFTKAAEISGMIAIGNKKGGYTSSDVEFLEPFSATVTNLIQAFWQIARNDHLINNLEKTVQERTKKLQYANGELEEANKKVIRASAAQLKHFACMSHEIRTPLNCILGLSSMLMETKLEPSQMEDVKMIVTSGDLLLTVVNDVLDYSKLESGAVEINIKECNLQDTLNAVVHSIKSKSKSKKLSFKKTYDMVLPESITMDGRRVQQILYNLLGNAIKFSKDEGTIELTVRIVPASHTGENAVTMNGQGIKLDKPNTKSIGPATLRFDIKDYGKGIETSDFSKIFEPFRQATAETEGVYGGTGLGLAISTKLVRALGGEISVDSVVDEWSEFTVEFPLKDPIADVDAISASLQDGHIVLICTDSDLSDHVSSIFQAYKASFSLFTSLDEIESLLKSGTVALVKRYIFLVDENLYVGDTYQRIRKGMPIGACTLYTFGAAFLVKDDAEDNLRDMAQIFPSVLMGKLSQQTIQPNRAYRQNDASLRRLSPFAKPRYSFSSLRVLIAEDNLINQKVLIRLLKRLDVEDVTVADNGQKAVALEAADPGFDMIMMDYQMPIMNGVQACQQILSRERDFTIEATPKVLFLTAHVSRAFEKECYDAGADGFLPKPFNIKDIQECLETLLFESTS